MLTHEQRAHDLAILYMQMQIKEGRITTENPEDYESLVNEYKDKFNQIMDCFENV